MSAVLLLQAKGRRVTARELALELGVSVRTVYRDMDALAAAGIPLYGDAGPGGGYRLLAGYRTRLTGITRDEAAALPFAGAPGTARDLGLGPTLAAVQLKLAAALPDEVREQAEFMRRRFHLDTTEWYSTDDAADVHLGTLVRATCEQRRVLVGYQRWTEPQHTTAEVDPYGLVLKSGRWYLVAARGDVIRTFRVSHILRARLRDERFERPTDFDIDVHWERSLRDFDERRITGTTVVRMTTALFHRLSHMVEPALHHAATATAEYETDGHVRVTMPMETIQHTAGVLLRLGAEAEVLHPPALRAELRRVVNSLGRTYASTDPAGAADAVTESAASGAVPTPSHTTPVR